MVYWREKFKELEELIKTEGYDVLAPEDLIDHSRMRRFVYDTASILRLVKDVLRPRDFDEFVKYGFADPGKPTAYDVPFRMLPMRAMGGSVASALAGQVPHDQMIVALAYGAGPAGWPRSPRRYARPWGSACCR